MIAGMVRGEHLADRGPAPPGAGSGDGRLERPDLGRLKARHEARRRAWQRQSPERRADWLRPRREQRRWRWAPPERRERLARRRRRAFRALMRDLARRHDTAAQRLWAALPGTVSRGCGQALRRGAPRRPVAVSGSRRRRGARRSARAGGRRAPSGAGGPAEPCARSSTPPPSSASSARRPERPLPTRQIAPALADGTRAATQPAVRPAALPRCSAWIPALRQPEQSAGGWERRLRGSSLHGPGERGYLDRTRLHGRLGQSADHTDRAAERPQ